MKVGRSVGGFRGQLGPKWEGTYFYSASSFLKYSLQCPQHSVSWK